MLGPTRLQTPGGEELDFEFDGDEAVFLHMLREFVRGTALRAMLARRAEPSFVCLSEGIDRDATRELLISRDISPI